MNEIDLGYALIVKLFDAVEAQRIALLDLEDSIKEYQEFLQKQAEKYNG